MEKIFIDTNVIIDLLRGRENTVSFFKRVEAGDINGFTNRIVFLETIHVYLILTTGKGPLNLRKKPEFVKSADISPILDIFEILYILPTDRIEEKDITEIITKYGLLPNDALIAATCKHYGIKRIATFDEDFKRVDFLEILEV
ncbi:ribonuclease VapC [Archaeoglobales archaeon]|nr:MAG: ribonuclease VapC [Archaeoglobales archaeon]